MDGRPQVWAFGISRLRDVIRDVAAEYDATMNLRIVSKGFEDAVQEIESAGAELPDVVVSAGANGAYLKARVPMPVTLITPTGFDVMHALERARRIDRGIGLIMHGSIPEELTRFLDAFDADVQCVPYFSGEDAEISVAALRDRGVKVIVGPGLVTELAARVGLDSVFLYSRASVRYALDRALEVARAGRGLAARFPARNTAARAGGVQGSGRRYSVDDLTGDSEAMRHVRESVIRYGRADATVLLLGETGTGKEVAAQAIHRGSARRDAPFIAINCGALPDTLLESELFGHDEGAFTGARRGGKAGLIESAHRGTVFLDEIAEMSAAAQSRLLRVLQEREVMRLGAVSAIPVDVRFVVATHKSLDDAVTAGAFRADLYYRLNILQLRLPPLRERGEDIVAIACRLLQQQKLASSPAQARTILAPVEAVWSSYRWPGNVRELQNIVARIGVEWEGAKGTRLSANWLRRIAPELWSSAPEGTEPTTLRAVGRQSEAEAARRMLASFDGDRDRTAQALGISKTTLWRRLR